MHNNINALRQKRNLTMKELADIVGTSQQQIDRLEKGKRRITAEWMQKLSKALNVAPMDLVTFTANDLSPPKIQTAVAKVIGAIETQFSNMVRKFDADEQYDITFRPAKKDMAGNYFALVVEGGSYKNYPANSELIFAESARNSSSGFAESGNEFTSGNVTNVHKFEISGEIVEGYLVKSLRSE